MLDSGPTQVGTGGHLFRRRDRVRLVRVRQRGSEVPVLMLGCACQYCHEEHGTLNRGLPV
jgi:hypothetical protein